MSPCGSAMCSARPGRSCPLFARQLAAGGPLTVTDPEADRFFMTVREAVELVLQASALSPAPQAADARGKIFVLDMGEPVKIVDLAQQMIRLAGLRLDRDIKIEFIGLRPGEKLHEELFHPAEPLIADHTPGDPAGGAAHRRLCDARPRDRRARREHPLSPRRAGAAAPRAAGSRIPPCHPPTTRRCRFWRLVGPARRRPALASG